MIDWMVFYAAFNSISVISRDSSHYSCLSWVSPVLGWALKCLARGHSHEKTQRIQCGSNPGLLDYESNTLPLSHAGPEWWQTKRNTSMLLLLSCITTTSWRWRLGSGRGDFCPLVLRLLLLLASCWLAVSLAFNRRGMDLCRNGNNLLAGRGCFSLAPAAAPTFVADPLALERHTSAMLTARWLKWK